MTAMDLTQRTGTSSSSQDRPVLPNDNYRMRIMDAKLEDDPFATEKNRDGSNKQQFTLTFEITTLTVEQQEAAAEAEQEWDEVRIWHHFNPFYGDKRAGGPSKFKEFLDNLIEWGLVSVDLTAFDVTSLVGIELKCTVIEYTKTMGANKGSKGNKITGFAAIKGKRRNVPQAADGVSAAETRFFREYSTVIDGVDWAGVQQYLSSRAPKPTTVEGWIAAAEAVRAKSEAPAAADEDLDEDGEPLPF